MPPCGAREVHPKAMLSAPVTADPAIREGITRNGSPAANGIAPPVMNDAPSTQAALPFSCSTWVNSLLRNTVARARPSGGGMPPPLTAAMIWKLAGVAAARPRAADEEAGFFIGAPLSNAILKARMMARGDF